MQRFKRTGFSLLLTPSAVPARARLATGEDVFWSMSKRGEPFSKLSKHLLMC